MNDTKQIKRKKQKEKKNEKKNTRTIEQIIKKKKTFKLFRCAKRWII